MKDILIKILIFILKPAFVYKVMIISASLFLFYCLLIIMGIILAKKIYTAQITGYKIPLFRFFIFFSRHKLILIPIFLIFVLSVAGIIIPSPKVIFPSSPAFGVTDVTNKNPLRLEFDRPINSKISFDINPKIEGHWSLVKGKYPFVKSKVLFYPDASLPEESVYTISVSNISNLIPNYPKNYLFSFKTPIAAKIQSVNPQDNVVDFDINQPIKVILDRADQFKNQWQFALQPETPSEITITGNTYTIKSKDPLRKGTQYSLTITRTPIIYNYTTKKSAVVGEAEQVYTSKFTTVASPKIKSSSPAGGGILTDVPIKIEFRQAMDQASVEKAWSITPAAVGKFSWSGNTVLFASTQPLQKNTTYKIIINKSATSVFGTSFDEDYSFAFTTIGYAAVSAFVPGNGAKNINLNQAVSVTFNQAVDHGSAQSKFSFNPPLTPAFSWSGNKMNISHPDFAYSQTYTIKIDSGVKSTNGLDSNQAFTASFTTKSQSKTLNVPSFHQSHMYSCYATSAKSALAYKGVNVSENTILNKIGYDKTPWSGSWNEPGSTWGDPNKGIVGSVDGKANNIGWGYGAYWGPVAAAINQLGRPAEAKTGWNVQGLAREISAGNPVIIWWVNGVWPAYEVYWYNNGNKIRGVNSLHVQVVKGFTGTVDNPTSFSVTDSGYGYPGKTFDIGTFKAKWGWFNNSGIVVR